MTAARPSCAPSKRHAASAPSGSSPSTCCWRLRPATPAPPTTPAGRSPRPGLDAARIERAIEQDLVAALDVVGVPATVVESTPVLPGAPNPSFSVPVKEALERALRAAVGRGDRRMGTEHLLLGLLDPPAVAVARVLAVLDVEPERLAALVQVEMATGR